jgi:hypothetical protein
MDMLDRGHPRAYLTDVNNAKGSLLTAKASPKRMGDLRTLSSTHEHDQSHRFIPCGATLRADLGLVAKGDG